MSTQLHKKGVLFQQLKKIVRYRSLNSVILSYHYATTVPFKLSFNSPAQPTPQKLWQEKDQMKRYKNNICGAVLVSHVITEQIHV